MYKYETHLHTSPVSKCARSTAEEMLNFYKKQGYDGVFITNHFIDGNCACDRSASYEEQIDFYFSDYEKAKALEEKIGIKVFLGVELSNRGTDFLVYGLNKQWFLEHPEIVGMKKSEELTLMAESGALIIQAHPYREAAYIDHIRLFPRHVHGVEIINGNQSDFVNGLAEHYAKSYSLIPFAGSDNHSAERCSNVCGMKFKEPINSVEGFIEKVKGGEGKPFKLTLN
jgi:hypothetical protein